MSAYVKYLQETELAQAKHSEWRVGQTLFNVLYSFYPDIADTFRGTEYDPFYCKKMDDEVVQRFLALVRADLHG